MIKISIRPYVLVFWISRVKNHWKFQISLKPLYQSFLASESIEFSNTYSTRSKRALYNEKSSTYSKNSFLDKTLHAIRKSAYKPNFDHFLSLPSLECLSPKTGLRIISYHGQLSNDFFQSTRLPSVQDFFMIRNNCAWPYTYTHNTSHLTKSKFRLIELETSPFYKCRTHFSIIISKLITLCANV